MADIPTLTSARTAADIIEACARFEWWANRKADRKAECPPDLIPTETTLSEWYPQCPAEAKAEAARILSAIAWHDAPDGSVAYSDLDPRRLPSWEVETRNNSSALEGPSSEKEIATAIRTAPQIRTLMAHVPADADADLTFHKGRKHPMSFVHEVWQTTPEDKRPKHPLRPLVRAWQERPQEVAEDARANAIVPGDLFAWAGCGAPAIIQSRHDNEVPMRPGPVEPDTELYIPGLEPPRSAIIPASVMVLAEEAGFGKLTPGNGARIDKRLLTLSLLAIPREERRAGGRYTLRPTLRRITHDWLFPAPTWTGTGKSSVSSWKPSRHAELLGRAMDAITVARVLLPDGRGWAPVVFRVAPDFRNLESRAQIEIALPDDADHGPLINRAGLIAAGVVSDMAFDGSLVLATLWDEAKARNGGFRIYATRPKALRDAQGFLTRPDGSRILGHERNPFSGAGGRPAWRPGEAPQRDWRHPEAKIIGTERHPHADKVPLLDRNDRRRLFYGRASDRQTASARAMASNRADARLETLEEESRVVIERKSGGWRILEPPPMVQGRELLGARA